MRPVSPVGTLPLRYSTPKTSKIPPKVGKCVTEPTPVTCFHQKSLKWTCEHVPASEKQVTVALPAHQLAVLFWSMQSQTQTKLVFYTMFGRCTDDYGSPRDYKVVFYDPDDRTSFTVRHIMADQAAFAEYIEAFGQGPVRLVYWGDEEMWSRERLCKVTPSFRNTSKREMRVSGRNDGQCATAAPHLSLR